MIEGRRVSYRIFYYDSRGAWRTGYDHASLTSALDEARQISSGDWIVEEITRHIAQRGSGEHAKQVRYTGNI
jgi:hypothetical protein